MRQNQKFKLPQNLVQILIQNLPFGSFDWDAPAIEDDTTAFLPNFLR